MGSKKTYPVVPFTAIPCSGIYDSMHVSQMSTSKLPGIVVIKQQSIAGGRQNWGHHLRRDVLLENIQRNSKNLEEFFFFFFCTFQYAGSSVCIAAHELLFAACGI